MKVGLYGGMANNMYVFAKALAGHGADVCFIRDRSDRYPFSQPVWEDLPFRMAYDEVPQANTWSWEKWSETERGMGWTAPEWLFDPLPEFGGKAAAAPSWSRGIVDSLYLRRFVRAPHRAPVLRKMQSCDALLVCGVEGSLLADQSGLPFVIWPHGGDTMIAAGMFRPRFYRLRSRLVHALLQRQLVTAYANAVCMGSHEPTGIRADYLGAEDFVRKQRVAFVPIPIPVRQRPVAGERRKNLSRLLEECGAEAPPAKYLGFVPSRVDFEWKGHDRLLRALASLAREGKASDIHLVFSGWGNDFGVAKRFVEENNLSGCITLLNCALSKPLLFQFFLSADFVVDQFIMGLYGTSALEAMACGAPVIMWINDSYERPWGAPPIIQARSPEDIAAVLRDIVGGRIDLEQRGRSLQQWMDRVHNPGAVVPDLMARFSRA
jgi:glycosyltransferase involved in cell wall biosynthesis